MRQRSTPFWKPATPRDIQKIAREVNEKFKALFLVKSVRVEPEVLDFDGTLIPGLIWDTILQKVGETRQRRNLTILITDRPLFGDALFFDDIEHHLTICTVHGWEAFAPPGTRALILFACLRALALQRKQDVHDWWSWQRFQDRDEVKAALVEAGEGETTSIDSHWGLIEQSMYPVFRELSQTVHEDFEIGLQQIEGGTKLMRKIGSGLDYIKVSHPITPYLSSLWVRPSHVYSFLIRAEVADPKILAGRLKEWEQAQWRPK